MSNDPQIIYARTLSGEWRCKNPRCNVRRGELHRCDVRELQQAPADDLSLNEPLAATG